MLNNEFHQPVLLARTAATVDRLSGGRLVLGWGTGYMESEHDAIGLPIRPPGPRVTRLGESLEVVRSLLDTGAATVDGHHHHVHLDDLGIRPASDHVPFLIGGHGRAWCPGGRFADVFQFTASTTARAVCPTAAGSRSRRSRSAPAG